ncbi:MAG: hypothetical protein ACK58T_21345, partial [Phycisphaerae bacterium]
MVVIAVVAVLISLLVPGLKMARRRAFELKCQANLKQQVTAWHAYINDFRVFPVPRSEEIARWLKPGVARPPNAPVGLDSSVLWSHGGVHWYGRTSSGKALSIPTPGCWYSPTPNRRRARWSRSSNRSSSAGSTTSPSPRQSESGERRLPTSTQQKRKKPASTTRRCSTSS